MISFGIRRFRFVIIYRWYMVIADNLDIRMRDGSSFNS